MSNPADVEEVALRRLIVLGAGAVGGGIGALLAQAGLPVVLIARGAHGEALRDNGLELRLPQRSCRLRLPCVDHVRAVDWRAGDVALLATKLQDAEGILDDLLLAAGSAVPVVCATNGVHGERFAAARFAQVVSTLVWLPATHLIPGEVRMHGGGCPGVLDSGPHPPAERLAGASGMLVGSWCARLRAAGFAAIARADIQRWKYAKWIVNLGGAAEALVVDDWRRVAAAARAEGERILAAAGVDRVATDELLERVRTVDTQPVDGQLREGGSTWQSRVRGRPLESAWLEGAMAALAAEIGVAAPVNRFLAEVARQPRPLLADEVQGV